MKKEDPIWISETHWACRRHMPIVRYPAHVERCWYHNCAERPEESKRRVHRGGIHWRRFARLTAEEMRREKGEQEVHEEPGAERASEVTICALDGCERPARPRSKYCSRGCSNKNARRRYKKRAHASS